MAVIKQDVIVIGAGMAGIKAAVDLKQAGYSVLVLEADAQIGGRMQSLRVEPFIFDQGASWVHGFSRKNPLTSLAQAANLKTIKTDEDWITIYDEDGSVYSDAITDQYYDYFCEAQFDVRAQGSIHKSFAAVYQSLSFDPLNTIPRLRDYFFTLCLEFDFGADISALSSKQYADDSAYRGPDHFVLNGYDTLLSYLCQHNELEVKLNQPVIFIDYSDSEIKVATADHTLYQAKQVVLTAPLGVLKAGMIEMIPALPVEHLTAIQRMGMGNVNKFLFVWDTPPFWDTTQYIAFTASRRGLFTHFLNYHQVSELQIPALMGFAFGHEATRTESMSDQEITAVLMTHLKTMYGSDIPEPNQLFRTRWGQNTFSRGAYSYAAVGSPTTDFEVMATPVENRLYFAGEHTSKTYRGTVHGAYLSGQRAAEQIKALAIHKPSL